MDNLPAPYFPLFTLCPQTKIFTQESTSQCNLGIIKKADPTSGSRGKPNCLRQQVPSIFCQIVGSKAGMWQPTRLISGLLIGIVGWKCSVFSGQVVCGRENRNCYDHFVTMREVGLVIKLMPWKTERCKTLGLCWITESWNQTDPEFLLIIIQWTVV